MVPLGVHHKEHLCVAEDFCWMILQLNAFYDAEKSFYVRLEIVLVHTIRQLGPG